MPLKCCGSTPEHVPGHAVRTSETHCEDFYQTLRALSETHNGEPRTLETLEIHRGGLLNTLQKLKHVEGVIGFALEPSKKELGGKKRHSLTL